MSRFIDNPRFVATLVGLVVVAGLSALTTIVRQEDPTITNGVALVITPFPGASAERVESLVTRQLEEELQTIAEISTLRSVSRSGISVVTVEIDETITGERTAPVFSKVRDAIDDAKARFPAGVREPIFDDERFGSYSMIFGLSAEPAVPSAIVQRLAEDLQDRLRSVTGTDHVTVFGAAEEQVHVVVDAARLGLAGLGPMDVAQALARADAKGASGVLRGRQQDILLETTGELTDPGRIREVPLTRGQGGVVARIGDVATVERGRADPPRELARVDGRSGLLVATQLAAGQRFDVWADRVQPEVEAFRAGLPEGVRLDRVFDQTGYTEARLSDLLGNLLTGLVLVVGVLFVSLGARSALVVTTALPLVTFAAIAVLRVLGVPIHQMSVTGLIVALGLLVDNAIVVTDGVRMRRARGVPRDAAARQVIQHLGVPLFASTATTVLAFMPIALLPGRVGEFVGTIGLSVIVALVASYLVAFLVVTPLAARFTRGPRTDGRDPAPNLAARGFAASLDWSVAHPKRSMLLAASVPLLGFLLAGGLQKQFFPPADRDQFHVQVHRANASSIRATEATARRVEAILWSRPEVRSVSWTIGKSAPPFYYNMLQNQDGNPAFAQALVQVGSPSDVARIFPALQAELDREVPEAQVLLRELLQGPPVAAPVEYRVYGPDLDGLLRVGEALRLRMSRAAPMTHARASMSATSPKLRVDLDETQVLLTGLRPAEVARQLQLGLEGTPGGSVLEGPEELPVLTRVEAPRRDVDRLRGFPLQAPSLAGPGLPLPGIPLAAVGRLELTPALDAIPRRNGERVNVVRGYTSAGVFPERAQAAVSAELEADPVELPPGYRLEIGGDAEKRADAMADLVASVPVLVILMIAAVALSLNSFRLAAVVFVIALQSMGFGLLSLALFGHPLGFQGIIGLIGLVGVAINAAIVIGSTLQADPRSVRGDASRISHVVLTETSRHIISTTVTTFGGFLPLILAEGGFWPPFASAIAGGVVLSTIGSFYFVPAAFAVLTRRRPLAHSRPYSEVPA